MHILRTHDCHCQTDVFQDDKIRPIEHVFVSMTFAIHLFDITESKIYTSTIYWATIAIWMHAIMKSQFLLSKIQL